jgi:hypothetical protein
MIPFTWAIEQLGFERIYNIDGLLFYSLKHVRYELEGMGD